MRNIALMLAAAGFALVTGRPTDAQAWYRIRLDNEANGTTLTWAGTTNTIKVEIIDKGDQYKTPKLVGQRSLSTIDDQHDFVPVSGSDADIAYYNIEKIIVTINGSNMFWLDQIELFRDSLTVWWDSGVDNTEGRCFSTDTSNYIGYETWCAPNSSEPSHTYIVQ